MTLEAKKWLEDRLNICAIGHSCQPCTVTFLPKRTLHFKQSPTGVMNVQLIENTAQRGCYVALSHCWGSSQHCVLTSEKLAAYQISVPWERLPKTFQDAIIFSANLDVYHIWIDALCIIQDQPSDWEVESAKMADIYQNSYITLAATASKDGMGGLYPDTHTAATAECELYTNGPTGIRVRKKVRHWTWPPTKASSELYPLLSRAWAFQERILSSRTLHFCKKELVWECKEAILCECGSLPELPDMQKRFFVARSEDTVQDYEDLLASHLEPATHIDNDFSIESQKDSKRPKESEFERKQQIDTFRTAVRQKMRLEKRLRTSDQPPPVTISHFENSLMVDMGCAPYNQKQENDIRIGAANPRYNTSKENWHRIVEQYSAMQLTQQTDRLPALSGLAARTSILLGDYFAGLWSRSIVSDLMWRVDILDDTTNSDGNGEYIGPSWSWTSISGPVRYWTDAENIIPSDDYLGQDLNSCSRATREAMEWMKCRGLLRTWPVSELLTRAGTTLFSVDVQHTGTNPYGRLLSGSLTIDGFLTTAFLHYTVTAGNQQTSDPLKYELLVHGGIQAQIERPFFADYILMEKGPRNIPNKTELYLILVHPSVCLVLAPVHFDVADSLEPFYAGGSEGEMRLNERSSKRTPTTEQRVEKKAYARHRTSGHQDSSSIRDRQQHTHFRRVGIVKMPWMYISQYGVDWMGNCERRKIIIL